MNLTVVFQIILFAVLTIYILVKEIVVPYRRKNGKVEVGNPVSIERFHQEFKDFKEAQCKWNEKIEEKLEKLDERTDELEKK